MNFWVHVRLTDTAVLESDAQTQHGVCKLHGHAFGDSRLPPRFSFSRRQRQVNEGKVSWLQQTSGPLCPMPFARSEGRCLSTKKTWPVLARRIGPARPRPSCDDAQTCPQFAARCYPAIDPVSTILAMLGLARRNTRFASFSQNTSCTVVSVV